MLLVDSSVWIDHFRTPEPMLTAYLQRENILSHIFVIGEIAMGSLRDRKRTIAELDLLPIAPRAAHDEVLALVENEHLFARGLSWIDAHLLASTLITPGARLWTRDKRLMEAARDLGVAAYLAN